MIEYTVKVYPTGDRIWWFNNKIHREDGPAVEYADGYSYWYLNSEKMTEEEHKKAMNPPKSSCEGKEVEIDGIVYVLKEKNND